MKLEIPYKSNHDFFIKYITFLNPLLKVKESDIPILASFFALFWRHKDYNRETIYSLLFSEKTKEAIRKNLGISEYVFNKAMERFKEKGLIVDNKFHSSLVGIIIKEDFNVYITFKPQY